MDLVKVQSSVCPCGCWWDVHPIMALQASMPGSFTLNCRAAFVGSTEGEPRPDRPEPPKGRAHQRLPSLYKSGPLPERNRQSPTLSPIKSADWRTASWISISRQSRSCHQPRGQDSQPTRAEVVSSPTDERCVVRLNERAPNTCASKVNAHNPLTNEPWIRRRGAGDRSAPKNESGSPQCCRASSRSLLHTPQCEDKLQSCQSIKSGDSRAPPHATAEVSFQAKR